MTELFDLLQKKRRQKSMKMRTMFSMGRLKVSPLRRLRAMMNISITKLKKTARSSSVELQLKWEIFFG